MPVISRDSTTNKEEFAEELYGLCKTTMETWRRFESEGGMIDVQPDFPTIRTKVKTHLRHKAGKPDKKKPTINSILSFLMFDARGGTEQFQRLDDIGVGLLLEDPRLQQG